MNMRLKVLQMITNYTLKLIANKDDKCKYRIQSKNNKRLNADVYRKSSLND